MTFFSAACLRHRYHVVCNTGSTAVEAARLPRGYLP
jgi:hypothetical protein